MSDTREPIERSGDRAGTGSWTHPLGRVVCSAGMCVEYRDECEKL